MKLRNALYAQSGGVTAVINASACGVLETARAMPNQIGKVFAGRNGILGVLREELIDTSLESAEAIAALRHTPGSAFGSCRYKLKDIEKQQAEAARAAGCRRSSSRRPPARAARSTCRSRTCR